MTLTDSPLDAARAALDTYDLTGCVQPDDIEHLRTALDEVDRLTAERDALQSRLLDEAECDEARAELRRHGPFPGPFAIEAAEAALKEDKCR